MPWRWALRRINDLPPARSSREPISGLFTRTGCRPKHSCGDLHGSFGGNGCGAVGILKSGAAYLPLDPIFPPDRLAFMLQDAQPLVLLTQENLLSLLPPQRAEVLCLDKLSAEITRRPPTLEPRRGRGRGAVPCCARGGTARPAPRQPGGEGAHAERSTPSARWSPGPRRRPVRG